MTEVGQSEATDDERDRLAEEWLTARHSPEWYVGDATDAEWEAAYLAVDELTSRGQSGMRDG
jgi:hypothetical protein